MRLLRMTLAILVGGLMAVSAWADDDGPRDGGPPRDREHRERMLERFDKDGDGKLNEEEREAAHKARHRDGDRRGEFRRHPGGPDGPPRGEFRRGPDGPPRGEGRRGPSGPPDGPRPPMMNPERMFERLDADGDGQLSLDEFKDGMERMSPPGPPPRMRDGERGRGPGGPDGPRFRRGGPDRGPDDRRGPGRPHRPRGGPDGPPPPDDEFGPEEA